MTAIVDLTEAVSAAAAVRYNEQEADINGPWSNALPVVKLSYRQQVLDEVHAVALLIERQVRERIAADIGAMAAKFRDPEESDYRAGVMAAGVVARGGIDGQRPVDTVHRRAAYNSDPCPSGGNHDWVPVLEAKVPTGREYCRGCDTSRPVTA